MSLATPVMTRVDETNVRNLSSINNTANLPLGDKTVIVTQKFNDDDVTIEQRDSTIADSKTRNSQNNEQQLTYVKQDLIGKKSNVVQTTIFDQQVMRRFNDKNNDATTALEYRIEKESHYNFVSFPFTQAEPIVVK